MAAHGARSRLQGLLRPAAKPICSVCGLQEGWEQSRQPSASGRSTDAACLPDLGSRSPVAHGQAAMAKAGLARCRPPRQVPRGQHRSRHGYGQCTVAQGQAPAREHALLGSWQLEGLTPSPLSLWRLQQ